MRLFADVRRSVRLGATAVWTGRAMIVWGGWTIGPRYFADGATFTPAVP